MTSFNKTNNGIYRLASSIRGLCIGTIAKSANSIDYGQNQEKIRAAEKVLISKVTGIRKKDILALKQVHGDDIIAVNEPPGKEATGDGNGDGFITQLPGVCIVIRTADCVPVFVFDSKRRVLGAVHSGWRGTRLSIAGKLTFEMKKRYGSECRDMHANILPSIGPESYTVREDVAGLFPADIFQKDGRLYLDLWRNIERSLREAGIPGENIFNASMCTLFHRNEFFSYRGGCRGRNLNFGYIEE